MKQSCNKKEKKHNQYIFKKGKKLENKIKTEKYFNNQNFFLTLKNRNKMKT